MTLGGGLGGLVAAEAEVSEGYAVAFGAGDRVCGYCIEGYAWRVDGCAAGYATPAARMGGGIGIIASLLFPTREAPSLYAFVRDPLPGPCGWPCEVEASGLCRALQARLEHAQSYRSQANYSTLQSV